MPLRPLTFTDRSRRGLTRLVPAVVVGPPPVVVVAPFDSASFDTAAFEV